MIEKIINRIKYRLDENTSTAEVIKKRGYKGEVIIPESVEDPVKKRGCKGSGGKEYSVNSIAESAFEGCSSLTAITIPASVTSIGMHAFKGCSSLTAINYSGTIGQWQEITLDDEWNKNVPTKEVSCTGGPVKISPNGLQMNPMYRLSMSSLELFHSNFLEWLFDIDHEAFLKCFSPRFSNPAACTIEREYHLGIDKAGKEWVTDIAVFENGNLILIIENKIKSTPSKGQLKYQSELADKKAKGCKKVLLSLFEYSVSKGKSYGFDQVLYKELCGQIQANYKSYLSSNSYINDYCEMLERLQNIIDADPLVINWSGGDYTAHMFSKKLEIYDMMDAFRKYQAASLADEFEKRFIVTNPTSLPMTCKHSLNNKHACTTIAYELNDRLNVGVQIEHDQLRIFFEDKNKKFKVKNVDTYWNIWFAPLKPQGKSKGGLDYCSYNMSKSLFIYRYVKLGDIFVSSPITINDLCIYVQCILGKIIAEYHSGKIFDVLK